MSDKLDRWRAEDEASAARRERDAQIAKLHEAQDQARAYQAMWKAVCAELAAARDEAERQKAHNRLQQQKNEAIADACRRKEAALCTAIWEKDRARAQAAQLASAVESCTCGCKPSGSPNIKAALSSSPSTALEAIRKAVPLLAKLSVLDPNNWNASHIESLRDDAQQAWTAIEREFPGLRGDGK